WSGLPSCSLVIATSPPEQSITWQGLPGQALGSSTRLTQVLLAGFGAMAFLRTSVFTLRVANHDVGIGPSALVQSLLRAVDSAVDRLRALNRDQVVTTTMAQVSF